MKYTYTLLIIFLGFTFHFCQATDSHDERPSDITEFNIIEDYSPSEKESLDSSLITTSLSPTPPQENQYITNNHFSKFVKETKRKSCNTQKEIQELKDNLQKTQQDTENLEKVINSLLNNGSYGVKKPIPIDNALLFAMAGGITIVIYNRCFPGGSFFWEVASTICTLYWMVKLFQQNASIFAQGPQYQTSTPEINKNKYTHREWK